MTTYRVKLPPEPIHPESYRTLRQLVLLHGAERIIAAVNDIQDKKEEVTTYEQIKATGVRQ